ncbi:hypothetical protein FACS18942_07140 [Planctomycetales bacterium]|nr:hypothetical protein FACS18942_07140 [Planctomycetales bacterium]GHT38424.1 hypothetical protein FACS189427_12500 [Planctomycetales bacterium]
MTSTELIVDPQLQTLFPPEDEKKELGLEKSLLRYGCDDPIIVWDNIIVDGYRRYAICRKHDIPFQIVQRQFEDMGDALIWRATYHCNQRHYPDMPDFETIIAAQSAMIGKPESAVFEELDSEDIRIDLDTQIRVGLDADAVADYVMAMQRGDKFPPIMVYLDEVTGEYILVDGFHRYAAHQQSRPDENILAEVSKGKIDAARWVAIGANKTNAVRRTTADKQRAVRMALTHSYGRCMSNRQIAEYVGVDEGTVRRFRHTMESTAEFPQSPNRTGRDGLKINTAAIGRHSRPHPNLKTELLTLVRRNQHADGFLTEAVALFERYGECNAEIRQQLIQKLSGQTE